MNYWNRRDLKERVRLFNLTERDLRKILKREYLRVYKDVESQLNALIVSLPPQPTANELYREDKLFKLLNEIQYKLDHLGNFEKDHMEKTFVDYFTNNYNLIDRGFNIKIDNERVLRAINADWVGDGKNFSDRLWQDKRRLIDSLQKGLVDTVATGSNWGELSKKLKEEFNTSYSNSKRLVRTELSHIQNESSLYKYEVEGVKEVIFVAEADCCEHCRENNRKVFDIHLAPKIPRHPACRCVYIPKVDI